MCLTGVWYQSGPPPVLWTNRWRVVGICSSTCLSSCCRMGTLILRLGGAQFYLSTAMHLLGSDNFHRGRGRKMQPGQRIHVSVILALSVSEYLPKAVFPKHSEPSSWEVLQRLIKNGGRSPESWGDWMETGDSDGVQQWCSAVYCATFV